MGNELGKIELRVDKIKGFAGCFGGKEVSVKT
jgi:hypothetical protein